MRTSRYFEFDDGGELVYFIVDTRELFNLDLDDLGLFSALKSAFNESKKVVPVATGLMLSSYTFKRINNHQIQCYFDPKKIIGRKRAGRIVDVYYPKYLKDTRRRYNWLYIVMNVFYNSINQYLKSAIKREKIKSENLKIFFMFYTLFKKEYKSALEKRLEEMRKNDE